MISFGRDVRVFVATQPIDFRKGVHGLVALVAEGLAGEPYSGDVFVFRSKRSDRLKLLVFDGSGLVLATKWLEDGDFAWPPVREGTNCGPSMVASRALRRHTLSNPRLTPLRRATSEMFTSGSALSARIRAFSASLQSRRRRSPVITSTR